MRLLLPVTALLLCASCGGQTEVTDPCVIRLDLTAPAPVRVGGTRVVEVDIDERSGDCSKIDKEIAWRSSQADVIEITASSQTSATIHALRVSSSTISTWLVHMPTVRDSITISVGALVDN